VGEYERGRGRGRERERERDRGGERGSVCVCAYVACVLHGRATSPFAASDCMRSSCTPKKRVRVRGQYHSTERIPVGVGMVGMVWVGGCCGGDGRTGDSLRSSSSAMSCSSAVIRCRLWAERYLARVCGRALPKGEVGVWGAWEVHRRVVTAVAVVEDVGAMPSGDGRLRFRCMDGVVPGVVALEEVRRLVTGLRFRGGKLVVTVLFLAAVGSPPPSTAAPTPPPNHVRNDANTPCTSNPTNDQGVRPVIFSTSTSSCTLGYTKTPPCSSDRGSFSLQQHDCFRWCGGLRDMSALSAFPRLSVVAPTTKKTQVDLARSRFFVAQLSAIIMPLPGARGGASGGVSDDVGCLARDEEGGRRGRGWRRGWRKIQSLHHSQAV
jgi:hypothetical protein